ncbi:IQ domain-containing protein N [Emydura macquarii macquarii]|uniref:IQ domain-containing protein N n=1 Tax=Emydura macquarii macquarii TaxID=1129001 RepID=UPI00352AC1CD
MAANEAYPSTLRPWRGHIHLSVEELHPSGSQSPQRPRSRVSPSRRRSKHRASSFDDVLVDEFDMLLDTAATVIQAAWRGHQARQRLCAQYHAAVAIQATWRGFLARERLASQQAEPTAWQSYRAPRENPCRGAERKAELAAWQGYGAMRESPWRGAEREVEPATWEGYGAPRETPRRGAEHKAEPAAWQGYGALRETPWHGAEHEAEPATWQGYGALRETPWRGAEREAEQAAVVIQAHYRGYRVRCEIYAEHLAAATIQAHYRGYRTRQALAGNHRAATAIQARWRGYRTRQELALAQAAPHPTDSLKDFFSKRCRGLIDYVMGSQEAPAPRSLASRRHALAGDQGPGRFPARQPGVRGAGGEKLTKPPGLPQRGGGQPPASKRCPQCGQSPTVRVLVGVGQGTAYQQAASAETAPGHPSAWREGTGFSVAAEQAPYRAGHGRAPVRRAVPHGLYRAQRAAHTGPRRPVGSPLARKRGAAPNVWHQEREPGQRGPPWVAQTAARGRALGRGHPAEWHAAPRHASASRLPPAKFQRDAGGTDGAWLAGNFWPSEPASERRVFKTRKRYWELARAATRIQAFWRGCQARRALREQREAAVKIQSAFRGYRTRADLTAAGVLSGGETEEEEDGVWSCQPGRYP